MVHVTDKEYCCNLGCLNLATHYMFWPGQDRKSVCKFHATTAEATAIAMGFSLRIEEIASGLSTENPNR